MSVPEPVLGEPLAESAIAVPSTIDVPATHEHAQSRSVVGVRGWLLTAFLFLVPVVAYWPATFHDYGLRDDYSNLREAHEEPGKILMFCASHARPIYGWLLQSTYGQTSSVQNLRWMRLFASFILGALSLVTFRGLRSLGWSFNPSLCVALAGGTGAVLASDRRMGGRLALCGGGAAGIRRVFHRRRRARHGPSRARGPLARAMADRLEPHGSERAHLSTERHVLRGAARGRLDCEAQAHARADSALARRSFELRGLGARAGLLRDDDALFLRRVREIRARRLRASLGRQDRMVPHRSVAECAQRAGAEATTITSIRRCMLGCAALVGLILRIAWRPSGVAAIRACPRTRLVDRTPRPAGIRLQHQPGGVRALRDLPHRARDDRRACLLPGGIARSSDGTLGNRQPQAAGLAPARHRFLRGPAPPLRAHCCAAGQRVEIDRRRRQAGASDAERPAAHLRDRLAACRRHFHGDDPIHDEFGSLSSISEWVPREMFKRGMHDLLPEIANINARYDFDTGPKVPADQRCSI